MNSADDRRDGSARPMHIRPAEPRDEGAVRRCAEAAYAPYVPRIGKPPAPMVADFAAHIAAGQVHVLAAPEGICGFAAFYPRGDHLHLENVAVDPAAQGRGYGRALVDFVEQEAARVGLVAVELYTNAKMTENLSLYPTLGYRETGRRREAGFDRIYFRKDL